MNLVVYGSLMKLAERRRAGFTSGEALPVIVDGYARSFDQMPSWRRGEGRHVAVLNAERDRERRMNAVLLLDASGGLSCADRRERGYERRRVDEESVLRHRDGEPLRVDGETYLYVGRAELRGRGVLPNREYLRICLEGAREWGETFYQDFLKTTRLCGGGTLGDFVAASDFDGG